MKEKFFHSSIFSVHQSHASSSETLFVIDKKKNCEEFFLVIIHQIYNLHFKFNLINAKRKQKN